MKKAKMLVLAIAAVFTIGGASAAWGAEGWTQSGTSWNYYDSYGTKVTDAWKKGNDGLWRYLDSSGAMAINKWVDNTYYVDSNGIMVTDRWLKLKDNSGSTNSLLWYYFGSAGQALMDNWKKIDNKWYYFDENGAMQTGWILDNMYYTGDDGAMRTGWQKLAPPSSDPGDDRVVPGEDSEDGKKWYYFGSSGKKFVPDDLGATDYGIKKIDGINYCFDADGAMQTGWCRVDGEDVQSEIQNYRYLGSDGKVKVGWLSMTPPDDLMSNYNHEVEWFYFSSRGEPKAGPKEGEASTYDLVKISGRTYLFNDKGNPVYGLQKLRIGKGDTYAAYYFGDRATSSMLKGKQKVEEGDGSTTDFYFSDSGRGYTGVKDGYLYYMGKVQKADDGSRYSVISLPVGSGHTNYVVNSFGKVVKSATVKNADGVKYKTGSNGVLLKEDDGDPSDSYSPPTEPSWPDYS